MCVCVCVKNLLKMWLLEFQCGFLKMPPGSHSGFLKLTSSAHRDMYKYNSKQTYVLRNICFIYQYLNMEQHHHNLYVHLII